MRKIDKELVREFKIGDLKEDAHKYDWGYSLIIAGSENMLGAALMAAESALEVGSGLVVVATTDSNVQSVMHKRPELMAFDLYDMELVKKHVDKATSICIGPGLVIDEYVMNILKYLLTIDKPLIIDASALEALRELILDNTEITNPKIIITPHHKEFHNLMDIGNEMSSVELAQEFIKSFPQINLVLKGAPTIVYSNDEIYESIVVNNKISSAGMGDSLAGVITGLVSYHQDLSEGILAGVYLHSHVADMLSRRYFKVNTSKLICNLNIKLHDLYLAKEE